jgi:glycosyltransferase involved in cell wall biosynthesis
LRVVLLTNYFPPEIGAASHLFYDLAESLAFRGHAVTVVTGYPRYNVDVSELPPRYRRGLFLREEQGGIEVLRVRVPILPRHIPVARGLDHFVVAFAMWVAIMRVRAADVVLLYSPPLTLGLTAAVFGSWRRVPFVINVQDLFPQNAIDLGLLRNPLLIALFRRIERWVYGYAARITVHSEGNAEYVKARVADPGKVVVVPNWVDTDAIRPGPRLNGFRRQHGLGDKFVVSFAGTMGYSQDLDTVIAAADLLRECTDLLFVLVGDGVERPRLEAEVSRRSLTNVMFLPMQPREVYPLILHASDACLVTLRKVVKTPVVPSKLLSIMAAAKPVLGSMNLDGDAPKLIRAAQCGLCVEPERPDQLAQAVLTLYNDRDLAARLGQNGRRYAEQHLSRTHCVTLYERVLSDAVARAQRRDLRE